MSAESLLQEERHTSVGGSVVLYAVAIGLGLVVGTKVPPFNGDAGPVEEKAALLSWQAAPIGESRWLTTSIAYTVLEPIPDLTLNVQVFDGADGKALCQGAKPIDGSPGRRIIANESADRWFRSICSDRIDPARGYFIDAALCRGDCARKTVVSEKSFAIGETPLNRSPGRTPDT